MKWTLAGAAALALAAGCGGGGTAAIGGSGTPAPEPGAMPYTPVATARVEVDVESGKVSVTPLEGNEKGRAIWGGGAVEAVTSDLLTVDGQAGIRSFNLSLKNNTGEVIGAGGGVRVQFRDASGLGGNDLRSIAFVSTEAGTGVNTSTDGPGLSSTVVPHALDALPGGGVVILEPSKVRIFRNGLLSSVASGVNNGGGLAVVQDPVAGATYAFYSEQGGHRIRSLNLATQAVSTVAGTGVAGDVLGNPVTAQFNAPRGLAWDGSGLLVADSLNGRVKRIPITFNSNGPVAGSVTLFQGSLSLPTAVAHENGLTAIAEEGGHRIRMMRGSGSAIIGSGVQGFEAGTGATARFSSPTALSFHRGDLYVVNGNIGSVSVIWLTEDGDPNSLESYRVAKLAGTGAAGYAEGLGQLARFSTQATGLLAQGSRIWVGDRNNRRLRAIDLSGIPLDGGFGSLQSLNHVVTLANRDGSLGGSSLFYGTPYIARSVSLSPGQTTLFSRVDCVLEPSIKRFILLLTIEAPSAGMASPDGVLNGSTPGPGSPAVFVQKIAGRNAGGIADGPVGSASFRAIRDMDVDGKGNLYVATSRSIVRMDAALQTFRTIAGAELLNEATVDGGVSARFLNIRGLSVSDDGGTIMVVQADHVLRVVQWNGVTDRNRSDAYSTATIAGSPGNPGNAGGVGSAARFNLPNAVSITPDGTTVAVVDAEPSRYMLVQYLGGSNSISSRTSPANYAVAQMSTSLGGAMQDVDWDNAGNLFYLHGTHPATAIAKLSTGAYSVSPHILAAATDADGVGTLISAYGPSGISVDRGGALWFVSLGSDAYNQPRLRRSASYETAMTVAGGGASTLLRGTGQTYRFTESSGILRTAAGPDGTVYVADNLGIHWVQRMIR